MALNWSIGCCHALTLTVIAGRVSCELRWQQNYDWWDTNRQKWFLYVLWAVGGHSKIIIWSVKYETYTVIGKCVINHLIWGPYVVEMGVIVKPAINLIDCTSVIRWCAFPDILLISGSPMTLFVLAMIQVWRQGETHNSRRSFLLRVPLRPLPQLCNISTRCLCFVKGGRYLLFHDETCISIETNSGVDCETQFIVMYVYFWYFYNVTNTIVSEAYHSLYDVCLIW